MFKVDLTDPGLLRRAVDQALSAGGLEVSGGPAPALFTPVQLAVTLPGGGHHAVSGTAVSPAPGGGFFVQLDPGAALSGLHAAAAAALERDEDGPLTASRTGAAAGVHKPVWDLIDSASDVPLHTQIAALSVNDRMRLARQASLPVRRMLIRDIDKRVHLELVKSPRVTDEEIVEYSRISGLSPQALRFIAGNSKFTRRRDVLMNLVLNPATPPDTAKKMLERLNQRELVKVLRHPKAREAIRRATKRKLMKAGVI